MEEEEVDIAALEEDADADDAIGVNATMEGEARRERRRLDNSEKRAIRMSEGVAAAAGCWPILVTMAFERKSDREESEARG